MPLEPICLEETDPPDDATDDELLVSQGLCPGCELRTAFHPDDLEGVPGALTCRYCGTRLVVTVEGAEGGHHNRVRDELQGGGRRRATVEERKDRPPPASWLQPEEPGGRSRVEMIRSRIEEVKRVRDRGPG